jgi:hypothetical protein
MIQQIAMLIGKNSAPPDSWLHKESISENFLPYRKTHDKRP